MKRLLSLVTEISKEQTLQYAGMTLPVLAEEVNSKDPQYLSGRLSNNSVVHFRADKNLIGQIVNVKLEEARGFYYYGTLADDVPVSGDKKTI